MRAIIFSLLFFCALLSLPGQCELPITNLTVTPIVSVAVGMKASQTFTVPDCTEGAFSRLTIFTETNNSNVTLRICPDNPPLGNTGCYVQSGISWQVASPESFTIQLNTGDPALNYLPETTYTFELTSDAPFRLGLSDFEADAYPGGNYYDENDITQANKDLFFFVETEIVLPVTYTHFSGKRINNAVQLNWATSVENNNRGFNVERSEDGRNWETIGFKPAQELRSYNENYLFIDRNPLSGSAFYRLKQLDFDGAYDYSLVIELMESSVVNLEIFPNPVGRGEVLQTTESAQVTILNSRGEVVFKNKNNTKYHQLPAEIRTGLYIVYLLTPGGKITTRRLVIR